MNIAARILFSGSLLFLGLSAAAEKGPMGKIQVNPAQEQTPGGPATPVPALRPAEPAISTAPVTAPDSLQAAASTAPAVSARTQERLDAARVAFEAGRADEARRMAERLTRDEKKFAPAWTLLGQIFASEKRYKAALRRFNRALKFDPHDAEAFFGKGQAYEALGKVDEAANEYQAAFHADENMSKAREAWDRLKASTSSAAG